MSFGLFANISSQSNYKNYITGQADRLFDYEYIYIHNQIIYQLDLLYSFYS